MKTIEQLEAELATAKREARFINYTFNRGEPIGVELITWLIDNIKSLRAEIESLKEKGSK